MPAKTTTVWTCSRCGRTEEVKDQGQPKNWTRVYFRMPPLAASDPDYERAVGDLCNPCGGRFVAWMDGKDKEEAAKDRQVADILERLNTAEAS